MTVTPLRVAVVGVGHLGQHHARILAGRPDVNLVGVVDVDESRAATVAARTGTRAHREVGGILDEVDAVTIAVPTVAHLDVARPFLERGLAVLVEKPMTRTVGEADEMLRLASRHGTIVAVGHSERFNPAVTVALPLVRRPRFIEGHRLGTFPDRSLDIDVIFDLMIHDLDLLLAAVAAEVVAIEAVGVPVLTDRVDIANVRLKFEGGCIANLTASRISREKVRKLRFFQPESYLSIDAAAREVEAWRLVRDAGAAPRIEGGRLDVPEGEPLGLELADFVDAVRHGRRPVVSGEDGRRALALADRIGTQMTQG